MISSGTYDGEIRINTKIETEKAKQQLMNLQNQMRKTAQKIETLSKHMSDMEKAKVPTDAYKEVQAHINSTIQKQSALNERMEKYIALGKDTKSNTFKSMQYDAAQLENTLLYLQGEMQDLVDSGQAFNNMVGTDKYHQTAIDLQNAQAQMGLLRAKAQGVIDKEVRMNQEAGKTPSKFKKMAQAAGKIGTALKGALSKLKKFTAETNRSSKGTSNLARSMKQMLLSMAVFQAMSKGMEFLKYGLQNLALYSTEYNKSMSELISSTSQLKNAFAVAFEPILNVVIPILSQLIGYLSSAANAVSRFFAILGGKSTYTKAIRQNKDYASSLNKVGSAADDAKGSLAGFDDLDVLQKNNSSSGGGGGSSDGADGSGFAEESVGEVSEWSQAFKDAIEADDWYGVGGLLAQKLNDAMATIDWSFIQDKAGIFAIYLASGLNGFIANLDWASVGNMVAQGLNTAIVFGFNFITTFDWSAAGSALYNAINGFITNLDWATLGESFGLGIAGVCEFLYTAIEGIDWSMLADKVWEFFTNIDWELLGENIMTAIGSLLGGVLTFILELLANIGTQIYESCFDNGHEGIEGFLIGMLRLLYGLPAWMVEHLVFPLIDSIAKGLGIEGSPSTVLRDMGKNLILGFQNGIQALIQGPIKLFTNMKERIINTFKGLKKDVFSVINGLISGVEGMTNSIISGINGMINALNSLKFSIPSWVPVLGGQSFGLSIGTISTISIPRLANGGITTGSTLANIGEAGREAVLPLENNTGWMDDLAEKLASKMPSYSGPSQLVMEIEGKEFARITLPYFNNESNRVGVSLIPG